MYKIKIRNVHAYNNAIKKNEDKLNNAKSSMKVQCPKCGIKYSFYAFEDKDRKICKTCGIWVYKDLETKKRYEEKEKEYMEKQKQREFEQMIKKYMKDSEENNKGKLGNQRHRKNRK